MTVPLARRDELFARAVELGQTVRALTPPNPWVGCVVVSDTGQLFEGATERVGGLHAEAVALAAAGNAARGATVYVTLEPCAHHGRTPPCADALVAAGVARVVIGVTDPDDHVAGRGASVLRAAGVTVEFITGSLLERVEASLAPYLVQRRTGRPFVVLKLASTIDGRTAAPDGTSQWITGPQARADAHRLRAESDAIVVGSGTVTADDPSLTVRLVDAPRGDPRRIVLGKIPPGAQVLPAQEHHGDLGDLLDQLGTEGVVQIMVEGGARVAHDFHAQGLVNRYVMYVAPALMGGDDARGLFSGPGIPTIGEMWRGRFVGVETLGDDLRIDLLPPIEP